MRERPDSQVERNSLGLRSRQRHDLHGRRQPEPGRHDLRAGQRRLRVRLGRGRRLCQGWRLSHLVSSKLCCSSKAGAVYAWTARPDACSSVRFRRGKRLAQPLTPSRAAIGGRSGTARQVPRGQVYDDGNAFSSGPQRLHCTRVLASYHFECPNGPVISLMTPARSTLLLLSSEMGYSIPIALPLSFRQVASWWPGTTVEASPGDSFHAGPTRARNRWADSGKQIYAQFAERTRIY